MTSGIYEIAGVGRAYVGQALDVEQRFAEHRSLLRRGVHFNAHLQHAWDKYGADVFTFRVLILVAPEDLTAFEQVAIDALPPSKRYNIAKHAAHSSIGLTRSPEARRRMSDAQKKRMSRPEEREKVSRGLTGKKQSIETRLKRSRVLKGRVFTLETRAKISAAKRGKFTTTEGA